MSAREKEPSGNMHDGGYTLGILTAQLNAERKLLESCNADIARLYARKATSAGRITALELAISAVRCAGVPDLEIEQSKGGEV